MEHLSSIRLWLRGRVHATYPPFQISPRQRLTWTFRQAAAAAETKGTREENEKWVDRCGSEWDTGTETDICGVPPNPTHLPSGLGRTNANAAAVTMTDTQFERGGRGEGDSGTVEGG